MDGAHRFAYEPVHDLRTGCFAGVEVLPRHGYDAVAEQVRGRGWSTRRVTELDASTVVSAVSAARAAAPFTPVQVDLAADTVLYARDRLIPMLDGTAVAPMLEVGPAISAAAPTERLVATLAELRRRGFRIALDGAGREFGPEVIAAVRPDLAKLEPPTADGAPDAGSAAAVRAVMEVCRAVGVPVAVTGVREPQRLAELYTAGAVYAQGPLLGGVRTTPEPAPATLAELSTLLRPGARAAAPAPHAGSAAAAVPPVRGLATTAVTVPEDSTAETVREAMRAHPDSAGVVLVDADLRPVGYLERSRFLLTLAGRFGHALWADKPAARLADPPRTIDERTPLPRALELSLAGDPARAYDDLVVIGPGGACRGVVTVAELWRSSIAPAGPRRSVSHTPGHHPSGPRPPGRRQAGSAPPATPGLRTA